MAQADFKGISLDGLRKKYQQAVDFGFIKKSTNIEQPKQAYLHKQLANLNSEQLEKLQIPIKNKNVQSNKTTTKPTQTPQQLLNIDDFTNAFGKPPNFDESVKNIGYTTEANGVIKTALEKAPANIERKTEAARQEVSSYLENSKISNLDDDYIGRELQDHPDPNFELTKAEAEKYNAMAATNQENAVKNSVVTERKANRKLWEDSLKNYQTIEDRRKAFVEESRAHNKIINGEIQELNKSLKSATNEQDIKKKQEEIAAKQNNLISEKRIKSREKYLDKSEQGKAAFRARIAELNVQDQFSDFGSMVDGTSKKLKFSSEFQEAAFSKKILDTVYRTGKTENEVYASMIDESTKKRLSKNGVFVTDLESGELILRKELKSEQAKQLEQAAFEDSVRTNNKSLKNLNGIQYEEKQAAEIARKNNGNMNLSKKGFFGRHGGKIGAAVAALGTIGITASLFSGGQKTNAQLYNPNPQAQYYS